MFPYSSHTVSGRGTGVLHSTLGRVFLFLFLLLCDNLLPAAQPQRRIGSRAMQKDNRAVESLRRRLFAARLLRFRLFEFVPFLPPLLQITGASHQNQRTRREREKGRERKRERERGREQTWRSTVRVLLAMRAGEASPSALATCLPSPMQWMSGGRGPGVEQSTFSGPYSSAIIESRFRFRFSFSSLLASKNDSTL
jgi:hypothetical protein